MGCLCCFGCWEDGGDVGGGGFFKVGGGEVGEVESGLGCRCFVSLPWIVHRDVGAR